MKKLTLLLLLFCSMLFSSQINWASDYQSALAKAQKEQKPIMFVISKHECRYCIKLKSEALADEGIIKELNSDFVPLIAHFDDGDYVPSELFTPGVPAIWFLLPDGRPMYQPLMGAVEIPYLKEALSIVKESIDEY